MAICVNCSRWFDGDECPICSSESQLVLHNYPIPDTSPWWARPTDYVGWRNRIGLLLLVGLAIIWTANKLGRTLSILLAVPVLGLSAYAIWLGYRNDGL